MLLTTDKTAQVLIENFQSLPKSVLLPTYLELCHYPKRRFEEICSRLLAFYLQPNEQHGLGDLFLAALLRLVGPEHPYTTSLTTIKVEREVYIEGKRLDLLVHSQEFALGIENKITARLYNPLDVYIKRIQQQHPHAFYPVVLSVDQVRDESELQWMKEHSFVNVTYSQLFKAIRPGLAAAPTTRYTIYATDFIDTIENLASPRVMNVALSQFFFDNAEPVEALIKAHQEHQSIVRDQQNARIAQLHQAIEARTKRTWWVYEGYDLGCSEFNPQHPKVGIESWFKATSQGALGSFWIQLRGWGLIDWDYYRTALLAEFSKYAQSEERATDGASLVLYNDLPNDAELIVATLCDVHKRLQRITSASHSPSIPEVNS